MRRNRNVWMADQCILLICTCAIIGCAKKREEVPEPEKNGISQSARKEAIETKKLPVDVGSVLTNQETDFAVEVADMKKIKQSVIDMNTDPGIMTKADLKARALEALGFSLLDVIDLKNKDTLTLAEAANLLLDPYSVLTSNDIAKISTDDPMRLFEILKQLRGASAVSQDDFIHDNRVACVYEYVMAENMPLDVRICGMREYSYSGQNWDKRKELIESAISLAEAEDSRYIPDAYGDLEYIYYKNGEYEQAIRQADKVLDWINKHPDYELEGANAQTARGSIYEMKIRYLAESGEIDKALQLLDEIKDSTDISEGYRKELNSEEFRVKVESKFAGSSITRTL